MEGFLELVSNIPRSVTQKLLGNSSNRELQSSEHYFFDKLNNMKASINEAHVLLLDEKLIFQVDNVSLQNEVDMLTSVCYDAEDTVSEIEYRIMMHRLDAPDDGSFLKKGAVIISGLRFWAKLTRLLEIIRDLKMRMEPRIKVEMSNLMVSLSSSCPSHLCTKCTDTMSLVGRDEEVIAIIKNLTSQEIFEPLGVSIVGMNGVGKSALAHHILNHDSVTKQFPLRLWVSLSGKFYLEEVVKQMVHIYRTMNPFYNATENNYDHNDSLRVLLAEKVPWLIVLDNLSDISSTEWDKFKSSFLSSSSRNKIIITTVNNDISFVTRTTEYCLHPLSDKHCQDIILRNTTTVMDDHLRLTGLIDTVAKKCYGLPIIANFVGTLLSADDKWRILLNRNLDLWEVPEFQWQIFPTLTATYLTLETYQLRQCFAYLSLFPHDYMYNMEELIHLWIAEGFIVFEDEFGLEDYGKEYFDTLVRLSILQPSSVDAEDGLTFKIHECTHRIAQLVASDTRLCFDEQGSYIGLRARNTGGLSMTRESIKMLEGLRTFLPLGHVRISSSLSYIFRNCYIRVLSLKHSDVVQIPQSISRLKFLRYLDISDTRIWKLPEVVTTLYNLQFLKLRNTNYLLQLPKTFNKLINLRHIDWELRDMSRLTSMPSSIGKLTSLQNLPLFVVQDRKGYGIEELCNMVHLRGSLCITNLENIRNSKEAASAKLSRKKSLKSLEFRWSSKSNTDTENNIAEKVLTALEPCENLRNLQITNYGGRAFPRWLIRLYRLETLHLRGCKFCPIGLRHLRELTIEDCPELISLEELFRDGYSFISLESLMLKRLPNLRKLATLRATYYLRELTIEDCPELISLPSLNHLKSLLDLQITDCPKLSLLPEELSPSLMSVSINNCALLESQAEAQDWSMITHIQKLWISGKLIQTSKRKLSRRGWGNPLLGGLKFIIRMRVIAIKKYTADLVNKLAPISEEKAYCTQQLSQFPHSLQMMLHCLLFPKDYEFEKERLVRLWIAAGFLEKEPMEDDGNRFFDFLLRVKFILFTGNDSSGRTKMYKFNSIECSSYFDQFGPINHFNNANLNSANVVVNRATSNWDISVSSSGVDQEAFGILEEFKELRTILFLNGSLLTKVPSNIFLALKFLSALDFSYSGIKELPDSIQNAKQLRYLDLSWTMIARLPDSITDLGELQDLNLRGCEHLFHLPKKLNKLTKLRHLDFDVLGQLTSMPDGIGELVELRTLWAFIVSSSNLNNEGGSNIRELFHMKYLSGKLCISGLENVMKLEDARSAGLATKPRLSQLELRWSNIVEENKGCNYVEVLQGLEPDTRLEHLQLICFPGLEFPNWVGQSSYINLVSIMLYRCDNCELLPSLGELPLLQKLEIIEINGVRRIDRGFCGNAIEPFPKLEMLTIDGMHSLEEWDGLNGNNLGSVVNLIIKHCPMLSELLNSQPCLHSLEHFEIVRCPKLETLPDGLLPTSVQTLIIEYCQFGYRYQEGGEDRNTINDNAEVWIFPDGQSSDEEDASVSGESYTEDSDMMNNMPNGV